MQVGNWEMNYETGDRSAMEFSTTVRPTVLWQNSNCMDKQPISYQGVEEKWWSAVLYKERETFG